MANRKFKVKGQGQIKTLLSKVRQETEHIRDLFPDIDRIYTGGRTLLTLAIENGETLSLIEAIIKSGADVNAQNSKGQTALMVAARVQRNDVLQILVESGAKVDLFNKKKMTALSICIEENNSDGVKLLVQSGADVHLKIGKSHETAIALTTRLGFTHLNKSLLHDGSDLFDIPLLSSDVSNDVENITHKTRETESTNQELRSSLNTFSQFIRSKDNGQKISFKTFSKLAGVFYRNGRLNCQDSSGTTLLMYAVIQRSIKSLIYILSLGPDVNIRDNDGRTALMYVFISRMDISTITLYILMGDCPCVQDKLGKTALMYALSNKYSLPIPLVKLLHGQALLRYDKMMQVFLYYDVPAMKRLGEKSALVDLEGRTHLMYAIEHIPNPKVEMLNELIADQINIRDTISGLSALMYAVYCNTDLIPFLLDSGANRNIQDNEGKTVFMLVMEIKLDLELSLLKDLIGETINIQDVHGRTALMYALKHFNSNQLIEHILSLGADVGVQDKDGVTALMISFKNSLQLWDSTIAILASNNINKQDQSGNTALMYAAQHEASETSLKLLMICGANCNIQNLSGRTPLNILTGNNKHGCCYNFLDEFYWMSNYWISSLLTMHNSRFLKCRLECILTVLINSFDKKLNERNRKIISEYFKNHSHYNLNWACSKSQTFLQILWRNGIFLKPSFVRGSKFQQTSSLLVALEIGHLKVAKFMVLNNYMTNNDFHFLRKFYLEPLPLFGFWLYTMSSYLTISKEAIKFVEKTVSQPWSLVKLSLITISTCVGLYDDRSERVEQLPIPNIMKNHLLFRSPDAEIPVDDWSKISLFD